MTSSEFPNDWFLILIIHRKALNHEGTHFTRPIRGVRCSPSNNRQALETTGISQCSGCLRVGLHYSSPHGQWRGLVSRLSTSR